MSPDHYDYAGEPDDCSGLAAWTDEHGRFFAVGVDGIAREYGDGETEAARLRTDTDPLANIDVGTMRELHRLAQADSDPVRPLHRLAATVEPEPVRLPLRERAAIIAGLTLFLWMLIGLTAAIL